MVMFKIMNNRAGENKNDDDDDDDVSYPKKNN